jgi:gliding motility associated protien GldN
MKKFSLLGIVLLASGMLWSQEGESEFEGAVDVEEVVVEDVDVEEVFVEELEAQDDFSASSGAESSDLDDGYNKFSAKGIHISDIMWQKTVLRAVDLREKQNEPLMSNGKELSQTLIDAVKAGIITPYMTDSLSDGTPLTKEEFIKNIEIPSAEAELSEEELAFAANEDSEEDSWDEGGDEGESDSGDGAAYFFAKQLYQMQIKEDMIFDKQRSVMYYDILALGMFVPADIPDNIKGIELPIAWFSYKELNEKVFKDNPDAIWYNPANDAEHRSLSDAFELRLFSSYIVKVSNPADEYIVDIYGGNPKTGIMASEWKAYELLEFEHNLWEF